MLFKQNAALHFGFLINNFLLTYLKFQAFPYHLSIQLLNDCACFTGCFPTYAVWAYHDVYNYFNKNKATIIDEISQKDMTPDEIMEEVIK